MKAAILVRLRRPLVIGEVELPRLGRGQVLVRVRYSGICGSQLGEIDGVKGPDRHLPHLLGHEGSGNVVELGPGVSRVTRGDSVVLHWRKGPGIESETPRYRWRGRRLNAGWVTTFNEFAVVSENRLTKIPEDFDPLLAPLLGCAVTTALGVADNEARIAKGESVLIFGAGGLGLSLVQAARLAGASPIVAVDRFERKLRLARRLGATHALAARGRALERSIRRIVGPEGADVAIDNTGSIPVIEAAYELTGPRGRTVLVGVPPAGARASIDTMPLHFGKAITGSYGGLSRPEVDIPRAIRLFRQGRLKLRELVTDRFRLERVNEAIAYLRRGAAAGRIVLEC